PEQESQSAAEALTIGAWRQFGQEVVITRSAGNYGPFQPPGEFIPASIISALHDEPVLVPGDGSTTRPWLHVEDHCSAIFAALLSGEPGAAYPLIHEQRFSDLEVAHAILEYLGKPRALVRL